MFLPGKSHGQRGLVDHSPWDHKRVGHNLATKQQQQQFLCTVYVFICVQLFATPWTVAHQVPLSMGFSRQEYWSGCHALLQGIFPTQGSTRGLLHCRWILYQHSVLGPLYSSFCSILQTQFPCLLALHPVIWPHGTLPSHNPRAWAFCLLFPCMSRAGFLLWFFSILSQSVNKKWKVRPDFGEDPRTKSQSWIQKDARAQSGWGWGVGQEYILCVHPFDSYAHLAWPLRTCFSQNCPDAAVISGACAAVPAWGRSLLFCCPFSSRNHFSLWEGASWW